MEYLNKNDWHARWHFYTTQSVHRKLTRLMVWFQIEMFIIWQWILFINPCLFYCPCLSINTVQKGLFQIEMITIWQWILFYKPVPSRVQIQNPARPKSTQNKKSTKNKETHKSKQRTWGLILFLLPVTLLNKDSFSPTLFSFALYRFTLLCSGKATMLKMTGTAMLTFSHTLSFAFLHSTGSPGIMRARVTTRMARANTTRVREWIILNNCFSLTLFVLRQVHRTSMLVGLGRVVGSGGLLGSGRRVRSGPVGSNPIWLFWTTVSHSLFSSFDRFTIPCSSGRAGLWGRVVGSGRVQSSPVGSLGWVLGLGHRVRSGQVGSRPVGSLGWVRSSGLSEQAILQS